MAPRILGRTLGGDVFIGAITNFFDALGVGSFATTTALYKTLKRVPDEQIPGTLNVGHALPTVIQAMVFVAIVNVEIVTLVCMISAAIVGATFGGKLVSRLPARAIQLGVGIAMLTAAALCASANLHLIPGGGTANFLDGGKLAVAITVNAVLGSLMMLGLGLYAPCLILVSLLGMDPRAGFPIMMGSCALLMPFGGVQFVARSRYDCRAAIGLAAGGIPGVLIAAYAVRSITLDWMRWIVVLVASYAALRLMLAARRHPV